MCDPRMPCVGVAGTVCAPASSGELGTEQSERRLCESGSTSEMDPCLFFFGCLEKALLKELLSCNRVTR